MTFLDKSELRCCSVGIFHSQNNSLNLLDEEDRPVAK